MMYGWRLYHKFVESLSNVLDFKCNSLLSVKPDVTIAQGIMVFWNITNGYLGFLLMFEKKCLIFLEYNAAVLKVIY